MASTEVFGALERDALVELVPHFEPLNLPAGATIIKEGEPPDSLYVVAYGRVQAFRSSGPISGGELGPGKVVGEAALLLDTPRNASVRTVRDSFLLRLSASAFRTLGDRHPQVVLHLHRALARHLLASSAAPPAAGPLRTVAVVPAGATPIPAEFAADLARALSGFGITRHVTHAVVDSELGADASQVPLDDARNAAVVDWLHTLEQKYRFVLYEADPGPTAWTRRCLRQADRVLLVGVGGSPARPGPVEQALLYPNSPEGLARRELVLIHPPGTIRPAGTATWLAARDVAGHHHLRRGVLADYDRLARFLAGRAIGLVLGGGGARGAAHLGVIRALEEAGIPIDVVGGTSSGALMGGLYAMGLDHETRVQTILRVFTARSLFQPTLPIVSLSSARRLRQHFESIAGGVNIEDLWTQCFCVSANLSRAELVIHDRGEGWRAVRASLSLPGILPPVWHNGDLLVDGAALNNLPVDVMRERLSDGRIIAVSFGGGGRPRDLLAFEPVLSGWREFGHRIVRRPSGVPTIGAVILRSMELASIRRHRDIIAAARVDLALRPPVERFGVLDFNATRELIDVGYRYTIEQLQRADVSELIGQSMMTSKASPMR
ncbi:MAG TPA: patatin-like phospholipase family protein [Acidimicrobiia bacterium]|nr:patatin-like phospholipase family protein [Acidimicrobiia bacterium]